MMYSFPTFFFLVPQSNQKKYICIFCKQVFLSFLLLFFLIVVVRGDLFLVFFFKTETDFRVSDAYQGTSAVCQKFFKSFLI